MTLKRIFKLVVFISFVFLVFSGAFYTIQALGLLEYARMP